MRAVLQRVSGASVAVADEQISEIGAGLVVLIGVKHGDTDDDAKYIARKIVETRIFEDHAGKMNLGLMEIGGEALLISQFTLYADTRKGRRPAFNEAAKPDEAEKLYDMVMSEVEKRGIKVARGKFGAHMRVTLTNDGPVTIILDSQ